MRRLNGTEMKTLFVLSILVPVGFLTGFRLTGVLKEPAALETIAVEPVSWQIDRPKMWMGLNEKVENTYFNREISVSLGLYTIQYREKSSGVVYEGRDGLEFTVYVKASIKPGLRASFAVRYYPSDNETFTWVWEDFQTRDNVTVTRMKWIGSNVQEAYIEANSVESPAYLSAVSHWIFENQDNENHELKIVLEFTYQNKSINKKVVVPLRLEMVQDAAETFENAKNITAGEYQATIDLVDAVDTYRIELQKGQTIQVTMTPPQDANFDLHLYDPNRVEVANSTRAENENESINFTAQATGTFYVQVGMASWPLHLNVGAYKLHIDVST